MRYNYLSLLLLFGLFLFLVAPAAWAQAPAWQTAIGIGPTASVEAMVADGAGNLYMAGDFIGTLTLGATTLTSAGSSDIFVAKYNPATAAFVWVQQAGGTGDDYPVTMVASGQNVYIGGSFAGTTASFGTTVLTNGGTATTYDGFVAKLTDSGSTGRFEWAQGIAGARREEVETLAVNGTSVYVAGEYTSNSVACGTAGLGNVSTLGSRDVFLFKLTDNGSTRSVGWALGAGGPSDDSPAALAVNGNSVYMTGSYLTRILFGSLAYNTLGNHDTFITKITDAGATASYTWVENIRGVRDEVPAALALRGTSLYLAGFFSSAPSYFGSLPALSSVGDYNCYLTKLTDTGSGGTFQWAVACGGTGYDQFTSMALAGPSIYLAGNFSSPTLQIGASTLTNANPTRADAFVTKVTETANSAVFNWAQQASGPDTDIATSLAIQGNSVYVGGYGTLPIRFGSLLLSAPIGGQVGFLSSFVDLTLTPTTTGADAVAPVRLFPNPAHGRATVQVPAVPGTTTATLTILDALGRTLRTQTAATNAPAALDLTGLAPGLYAVRVAAGTATATQRLVVE